MKQIYQEYHFADYVLTKNSPLVGKSANCPSITHLTAPVPDDIGLMQFGVMPPIPQKPELLDHISTPYSIISSKIYEVLAPLNIYGIQLLPAVIHVKGKEYKDYWYLHIYNKIKCIDTELSYVEFLGSRVKGGTIALDDKVLSKIPFEKKIIFLLEEDRSIKVFHKSIVQKIMEVEPTGIMFPLLINHASKLRGTGIDVTKIELL